MGLQFLRHIERTRTLAFLFPLDAEDPQEAYHRLREEIGSYSEELARTPHCLVLTKRDLLAPDESAPAMHAPEAWGTFVVSAVTRQGLSELLEGLYLRTRMAEEGAEKAEDEEEWWVPE